jgi:hypothetical protein
LLLIFEGTYLLVFHSLLDVFHGHLRLGSIVLNRILAPHASGLM